MGLAIVLSKIRKVFNEKVTSEQKPEIDQGRCHVAVW